MELISIIRTKSLSVIQRPLQFPISVPVPVPVSHFICIRRIQFYLVTAPAKTTSLARLFFKLTLQSQLRSARLETKPTPAPGR